MACCHKVRSAINNHFGLNFTEVNVKSELQFYAELCWNRPRRPMSYAKRCHVVSLDRRHSGDFLI